MAMEAAFWPARGALGQRGLLGAAVRRACGKSGGSRACSILYMRALAGKRPVTGWQPQRALEHLGASSYNQPALAYLSGCWRLSRRRA